MSNHSIIEHRASYYYIRIEEDFLAICCYGKCSPHCKALILAILEHWINTKRARGEGNYVYLTIPQWIKHTYMLYERNMIIACLQELLAEGVIARRQIIVHDQKTFEYTLNVDAIHERIKRLPLKLDKETMPNLDCYLEHKMRVKQAREAEKAIQKGVVEKSTTVGDKSITAIEKSMRVVEKSTQQRIRPQNPNIYSSINSEGRKNDAGHPKATDPQPSFSHSSIPSSSSLLFSPEEETVYQLASHFKLSYLKRNEKNKAHCAKLAQAGIATREQIESLMQFCTQRPYLKGKDLNLGNLASELESWQQVQHASVSPRPSSGSTQPVTSARISSEANQRNLERLRQRAQAALAAEQAQKGTPSCTR